MRCTFALILLVFVSWAPLPAQIIDVNPAPRVVDEGTLGSGPVFFADYYGVALFSAYEPVAGRELWRTDGTPGGTHRLADITPGPGSSIIGAVKVVGPLAFVGADRELWVTDGTVAGTRLVKRFWTGPIYRMEALGDYLIFAATDFEHRDELWRSDGTTSGTVLIADTYPGGQNGAPYMMATVGDLLFFDSYYRGLWRTDGTPEGTFPLGASSHRASAIEYGDACYFATSGYNDLWRSDGTPGGTVPIKNTAVGWSHPDGFAKVRGRLAFVAGGYLWVSDGTTTGTERLPGNIRAHGALIDVDDVLYFQGETAAEGRELWRTDGTLAGTWLLHDTQPGPMSSYPQVISAGEQLVFIADDGTTGRELWFSDGTAFGTRRLWDLRPGPPGSRIRYPMMSGDRLYFQADDGWTGTEPWSITVGPTSVPVGVGYGIGRRQPWLRSTPPDSSRSLRFRGGDAPANEVGFLVVGPIPNAPIRLGAGCFAYVDPSIYSEIHRFPTGGGGNWTKSMLIPSSAGGARLVVQVFFSSAGSPLGFETTNGLHLQIR